MMIANDFARFANSLSHGYIKDYQASGIIRTIRDQLRNSWIRDQKDLSNYVRYRLEAEGFIAYDCDKITDWLWKNVVLEAK